MTQSISAEYGITVDDWATDVTAADLQRAADTSATYAQAARNAGRTDDEAAAWGAEIAMGQLRATIIQRRMAAARP